MPLDLSLFTHIGTSLRKAFAKLRERLPSLEMGAGLPASTKSLGDVTAPGSR